MTNQENAKQITGNCYQEVCPTPYRQVDLADNPPGLKCCGDPSVPLPGGINRGLLTGVYYPEDECCVENGRHIIAKRAPIDLALCPKPVPPEAPIEVDYNGCSVPNFAQILMVLGQAGVAYSGDRNEPTPPADGTARFSYADTGQDSPVGPCDLHDKCYQTCGTEQVECDTGFKDDLVGACGGVTGSVSVPSPSGGLDIAMDRAEICAEWAARYYAAVATAGGSAYRSAQESHCDCECS